MSNAFDEYLKAIRKLGAVEATRLFALALRYSAANAYTQLSKDVEAAAEKEDQQV